MYKKLILLVLAVVATGCTTYGHKITDYSDRSIVYGWLDVDGVDGNYMYAGGIKQYTPAIKNPYYFVNTDKFKDGFIFYYYGLPKGSFKLDYVKMQSCLGFICSNTFYTYDFGAQGSVATVKVKKPGTYYLGSYLLAEEKTGWLEAGKFSVAPTKKGPSQKEMLEYILKKAPSAHPIVAQRIDNSLRKVR